MGTLYSRSIFSGGMKSVLLYDVWIFEYVDFYTGLSQEVSQGGEVFLYTFQNNWSWKLREGMELVAISSSTAQVMQPQWFLGEDECSSRPCPKDCKILISRLLTHRDCFASSFKYRSIYGTTSMIAEKPLCENMSHGLVKPECFQTVPVLIHWKKCAASLFQKGDSREMRNCSYIVLRPGSGAAAVGDLCW